MNQIQLYDYQLDMVQRIGEAFKSRQSVMVQMPTGTGKTHVLVSVVKNEERRVKNPCVWIVTHRRELVSQIEDTLVSFGIELYSEANKDSKIRVLSIQWLTRHYQEIETSPSLIVIDEAHHTLAKTYAEVINAYPKAKKLGVTATPCRLNRNGFTDLFDELLCSYTIAQFIKNGHLSDFDYVSLNPNSEDQKKIDGLEKRATDGDYSIAEMQDVLDCKPSIQRLYRTVMEFVPKKKGIVYAINIEHAEHIAEYYMEHGIETVAISANTPLNERRTNIEKFKDGQIQILVNVDLFGEGFDCPDVEFVQLARPTLSLAKYLQMVGRGLRVAKDKECCTILDNVGLYRLFGLPTAEWNWEAMFRGMETGKGEIDVARDLSLRNIDIMDNAAATQDQNTDMVVISRHDQPKVYFQLAELQKMFRKTAHLRRMGSGYMGAGQYIRIGDKMQGMYKTYEDVRLNWRLVSKTEGGITKYYLLHEVNERMIYVGRKDPWSPLAVDAKEQYMYNAQGAMQEVKALEREYITGEKRRQPSNSIRKEIDGEMCLVTYAYYAVNKNRGNDFNSKDAYVCEHYMNGGYAISNNKHQIILDNLKSVKLSDDNIAEVVFIGEEKPIWVNLYTMQEFYERPVVERVGFMDMLRVDNNYYFYKNRDLTGIPMFDWSCIANDRIFLFLDLYVILRDQPDKVYYMDGERRGSDRWYLKLIDIANPNIKNFKEVPSSWLPKRN